MPIAKKIVKRARSGASTPPAPRRKTGRGAVASNAPAEPAKKNILVSGFQAITDAHQEALTRQRGVFESLLGLGGQREADEASPPRERDTGLAASALDPFGFRKFEDVFDQRVARALERLEWPTAESFAELKAEVEALRARVAALESSGRKR